MVSPVNPYIRSQTTSPRTQHLRGGTRHRSAYMRTARTACEANRTRGKHPGAALLSCRSTRLDVLPDGRYWQKSTDSCAHGAVSRVGELAAKPDRRACASPVHRDDQQVEGVRLDAKIVVPTKDSEQESPPAHTQAIQRQRTWSAPARASQHGSLGGFALRTACR